MVTKETAFQLAIFGVFGRIGTLKPLWENEHGN